MSKSRDALGKVLTGLRDLISTGEIAPGAPISIMDVAARFRVSVTPVREALARLAGEGVLRATRRLGYERPALGADDLAQLYAFREVLLLGAVEQHRDPALAAEPAGEAATLFLTLIAAARNAPLSRAYAGAALLLAPVARAEAQLLTDLDREVQDLWDAYGDRSAFRLPERLRAYHRRRRDVAAGLAALLHLPGQYPDEE